MRGRQVASLRRSAAESRRESRDAEGRKPVSTQPRRTPKRDVLHRNSPLLIARTPTLLTKRSNSPSAERAHAHDHAAPVLLRTAHAAVPRVEALFRRRGHLLGPVRLHHRRRIDLGHRQGHGHLRQRPGRVRHALPRHRLQAFQG